MYDDGLPPGQLRGPASRQRRVAAGRQVVRHSNWWMRTRAVAGAGYRGRNGSGVPDQPLKQELSCLSLRARRPCPPDCAAPAGRTARATHRGTGPAVENVDQAIDHPLG